MPPPSSRLVNNFDQLLQHLGGLGDVERPRLRAERLDLHQGGGGHQHLQKSVRRRAQHHLACFDLREVAQLVRLGVDHLLQRLPGELLAAERVVLLKEELADVLVEVH